MFKKFLTSSDVIKAAILGVLCAGSVSAQEELLDTQYVVQTDLETGVYVYIDIDGPEGVGEVDGSFVALLPIGEYGSRFELFAKGTPPDEELYHLYEILVGSYPEMEIKTWSDDPYDVVTRTRADMPFQVEMTSSYIDPTSEFKGKRALYFQRVLVDLYTDPTGETEVLFEEFYFDKNETFRAELIQGDDDLPSKTNDPTYPYDYGQNGELSNLYDYNNEQYKRKGHEYYRVYAWMSDDIGWAKVAEKQVQVWPIAEGDLDAIVGGIRMDSPDGMTFNTIPTFEMKVWDLYPTSQTSMKIYRGEYQSGTVEGEQQLAEIVIDYEPVNFNTIEPQSATQQITPDQWDHENLEDGVYTVEVSTRTPFRNGQAEKMCSSTFTLKRTIKANASLNTAEGN